MNDKSRSAFNQPTDNDLKNQSDSEFFPYEDIINEPHHVSSKHQHMSMYDRAAQFSPFSPLTAYGKAVEETIEEVRKQNE